MCVWWSRVGVEVGGGASWAPWALWVGGRWPGSAEVRWRWRDVQRLGSRKLSGDRGRWLGLTLSLLPHLREHTVDDCSARPARIAEVGEDGLGLSKTCASSIANLSNQKN